jgi:peptidoglycan/LPS O-acetylase OafA/YrhL
LAYRPAVDGLRAVAILGVVAYHINLPGITGGYCGVDVFFVISGYLITQLLLAELQRTGRISIVQFYARRARRLLPALAIVIFVTLLLGLGLIPPGSARKQLGDSAIASALFVANQYFLADTGGYFDGPSALKPLLHLWSLSVEEQFYLVWPTLLIAIATVARRKSNAAMRGPIAALVIASFLFCTWLLRHYAAAAFYLSASRAWELGVGALIAVCPMPSTGPMRRASDAIVIGGAVLIGSAFLLLEPGTRFPGPWALPAVIGTAMIIWADEPGSANFVSRVLRSRPFVAIGLVSYGWYLWHWPLIAFANNVRLLRPDLLADGLLALLALVLAALSLRFIENPLRYGRKSLAAKSVLAVAGGTIASIAALATIALVLNDAWPKTQRERLSESISYDQAPEGNVACLVDRVTFMPADPLKSCVFGARNKRIELVVWGDSHAMSWTPVLNAVQRDGSPVYLQLTMSGCRPLVTAAEDRNDANCVKFRGQVLAELIKLKAQGLRGLVISGHWPPLIGAEVPAYLRPHPHVGLRDVVRSLRPREDGSKVPAGIHTQVLLNDLRLTFAALRSLGLRTLVLLDPPQLPYPPADCLYFSADPDLCAATHDSYERHYVVIAATFRAAAGDSPLIRMYDPAPDLCQDTHCALRDSNGGPILRDQNHVSRTWATASADGLRDDFEWLLNGSVPASRQTSLSATPSSGATQIGR